MTRDLVKMVKPGEEPIEVNPLVVDDHKRLGWKVVETPAVEAKAAQKKADAEAKAAK